MGIKKLADLIRSDAPDAISQKEISDYSGNDRDHAAICLFYWDDSSFVMWNSNYYWR